MKIPSEALLSINECVLCWLATADENCIPNVSPKEIFLAYGDSKILIANINSPNSIKNILVNNKACLSIVDIFKQKGFKFNGVAQVLESDSNQFSEKKQMLMDYAGPDFPIANVIEFSVQKVSPILAPRYVLYPKTTEEEQIKGALKTYGVKLVN